MNIVRWWKMRKVLRRRTLIGELRGHNRTLNDVLARKHSVNLGAGENPSPALVVLGLTAVAARSGITKLAERLGLTWEEARGYS